MPCSARIGNPVPALGPIPAVMVLLSVSGMLVFARHVRGYDSVDLQHA